MLMSFDGSGLAFTNPSIPLFTSIKGYVFYAKEKKKGHAYLSSFLYYKKYLYETF